MNDKYSTTEGKTSEKLSDEAMLSAQWKNIDWHKAEREVNRLQTRIVKATQQKDYNAVKRLQYLLTHSFYAKALAVKRVVTNDGRRTPGVDGVLWNTPAKKMAAALSLTDKRYRARPLRRVYIEKKDKKKKRPLGMVYPRELYQRGVERKRVELIAAHFNEYVANEPKVSFRNGQFIVTDGQHTIEGRILRNGGKDLPILCKVYTGMTVEQEALLFAEQNGFSAPLTAGIKLRAKVVGGDAISKAFLAATNRVGLSLNYDSQQLTDYRIGCVGTAFRLYKQMGEPLYCETMRLIVAAWEGKPDSFRASVLKGMMHFVELYHGEFSEERLLRALCNIHPVDIYRIGQDDPAKLRGWKKYVFPIYTAYNGKCRKDALPMKF